MGTEILRPQDCLAGRMVASSPAAYPRQRSSSYRSSSANPRPNRRHHQHQQRKRPVVPGQPEPAPPGGLVTGKAAVLRRGDGPVVVPGSGPEPEMARKQAIAPGGRAVVYAGSAFAVSPEPSSLPLPSFSKEKKKQALLVDDSATRDLRRLLRLDLL